MQAAERIASVIALLLVSSSAVAQSSDPISARIDPPSAALDWAESLPRGQWILGALLWKNLDACNERSCQAVYNASPVSVLVWRESNCCGQPGHSLEFDASVKGCSSRSYYLVFSKDIEHMTKADRQAFLARHVSSVVNGIASACGIAVPDSIPTSAIADRFD
jgi:hypothetical protein